MTINLEATPLSAEANNPIKHRVTFLVQKVKQLRKTDSKNGGCGGDDAPHPHDSHDGDR